MTDSALEAWVDHFDGRPTVVSRAPGRVNLIGEHTDYNDGFVFPAAIDRFVDLAARFSDEDRFVSAQIREAKRDPASGGWRRYVEGCRKALETEGFSAPPLELVISSNVPSGSGLSSSAALELAVLGAWNTLCEHGLAPRELAEIAWRAENEFVRLRCGRMDQYASALGKDGCALFIDIRALSVEPCALPEGLTIGILDTRKPRSLAASKYNDRVAECARAVNAVARSKTITSLRDASIEDLESVEIDPVALRRARHVITENQRVVDFRSALHASDFTAMRELCDASHESLRDDYEVSIAELDAMVRAARNAPGCVCARLTGAGFGGCCVALVHADAFDAFKNTTRSSYEMYGFTTPQIFSARPVGGSSSWVI
ncbi:MAG: galactokinase [Armatimonadota bacterium]|nr:galactokinase [Armatimonadota bacterium]